MNWKALLRPIYSFLLKYLRERFVELSKADGKPGLSLDDFKIITKRVALVNDSYKGASGITKAKAVGAWVANEFKREIDEYLIPALVSTAYEYANKIGSIK